MITSLDKNTALVLIDLQNMVVKMAAEQLIDPVIRNSAKLLAAFRKAKLPVVIVNVNPVGSAASKTRKDTNRSVNGPLPDNALNIIPEIKAEEGDILITKETWNAFYNTKLHTELQHKGITGIILAGVSTSIGVEGTARSANEYGYHIAFASDAMTDLFPEAHAHSFKYIFPRLGEVGTTDEIIAKLGE
jgi:nicotinamidase-related amidase